MPRALTALLLLLISLPLCAQPAHPILAVGAAAPDFALPGWMAKFTSSAIMRPARFLS